MRFLVSYKKGPQCLAIAIGIAAVAGGCSGPPATSLQSNSAVIASVQPSANSPALKTTPATSTPTRSLRAVDPPSPTPPKMTVRGLAVEALSYEWYLNGGRTVSNVYPDDSMKPSDLPEVTLESGVLRVALWSSARPSLLEVKSFAELGADGLPSGELTTVPCENGVSGCAWRKEGTGWAFTVPVKAEAKFVILQVNYPIPIASGDDPSTSRARENFASYGVRVKQSR